MSVYLEVTSDDIHKLSDFELRELIGRLAELEVTNAGHSPSAVTWGGDQRAKDGGIDVRVALTDGSAISGYVPTARTGFQVKAEDLSRADIAKEMMPNGEIRTSIAEFANTQGAYIITSSKGSLSDSALRDRRDAMQNCIADAGLAGKILVDFYDRRRIATWVEQHPSLIAWVREKVGRGTSGWQAFGPWAHKESDISNEYIVDDKVKLLVPNSDEGLTVIQAIDRLRTSLSKEKTAVRITGLSGVGKTRLVQALFDERIETPSSHLNRNEVLYTDVSDNPSPVPIHLAEALLNRNDRSLLIVDNCGPDLHQRLTEKVQLPSSKLSLITIEYDIRKNITEGTQSYRLEPSSEDLIKKLVHRKYPHFTAQDINTISEFSGGNARVAFALADTSNQGGQLSKLEDQQLFLRLFHQTNDPDNELLRAAEVCALLYSFEGECEDGEDAELPMLADFAEMSFVRLYGCVEELKRRGLIQQRGRWRAVLPHAIANRLAQRALQNFPRQRLLRKFGTDASERVARSFSRRIGYLHEDKIAKEIAAIWLGPDGQLAEPQLLNELGADIFSNVAPVDPERALAAISKAATNDDYVSTKNENRSKFLRLLKSIAYDPDLFEECVHILKYFVDAEPEDYSQNSARETLQSLFYVHFSGTETSPEKRAVLVRDFLTKSDSKYQIIGFLLLSAALKTTGFMFLHSFDFGARSRGYGWLPKTSDDLRRWFEPFFYIASEFGTQKNNDSVRIRLKFADKFRGLWTHTRLYEPLSSVAELFHQVDGWPEGWRAIRTTIQFDLKSLDAKGIALLQTLEMKLSPNNLITEIRAKVFGRGHFDIDDELLTGDTDSFSARHNRWVTALRELGRRAGCDREILSALSKELFQQNTGNVWSFGEGVGDTIGDPVAFLWELKETITGIEPKHLSFQFIYAFLRSAQKLHITSISQFMNEALTDDVYGPYFPSLQTSVCLDDAAVQRLVSSIEHGLVPTFRFGALANGRATCSLEIGQIAKLVFAILPLPGGQSCVGTILTVVIALADNKDDEYREQLRAISRRFFHDLDWDDTIRDHDIETVCQFAVGGSKAKPETIKILRKLRKTLSRHQFRNLHGFLNPMFEHHADVLLDEVYQPDDDGTFKTASSIISASDWEHRLPPINMAPIETVVSWCAVDPSNRISFISHNCRIFDQDQDENAKGWTDLAIALLASAEDKLAVFKIYVERTPPSSWSGSRAAIIRHRIALIDQLSEKFNEIPANDIHTAKAQLEQRATQYEHWEQTHFRDNDERFE